MNMTVHVRRFKTGEVAKLASVIESRPGEIYCSWTLEDGWHVEIECEGVGCVRLYRSEDVVRLAEFLGHRAKANGAILAEIVQTLHSLAAHVTKQRAAGALPPGALARLLVQGSA